MAGIIDWEKHDVPVGWKPGHEKRTVKILVSNFHNLRGSDPRRRNWQDDQQSPDGLQNHGRAGQAASLESVFLAAALRMSLCPIIPWKQERNTDVEEEEEDVKQKSHVSAPLRRCMGLQASACQFVFSVIRREQWSPAHFFLILLIFIL